MPLQLETPNAELKNLNLRKEGSGDQGNIAIDMKIKCLAHGSVLKTIIGGEDKAAFWRDNADKDLMFPGLGACDATSEFDYHRMEFDGQIIERVKLSSFSFEAKPGGMVELSFNATVSNPTNDEENLMKERLKGTGKLIISADQDLIDQMEADQEEED